MFTYTTPPQSFTFLFLLFISGLLFVDAADVNGYSYKSCQSAYDFLYLNTPFVQVDNSTSLTVESCTTACSSGNYQFAALYTSECFCGTTFTAFAGPSQDSECTFPCPGNNAEICGGYYPNAIKGSEWWSLYELSSSSPPSSISPSPTPTPSASGEGGRTGTKTIIITSNPGYISPSISTPISTPTSTIVSTTTESAISCAKGVVDCPASTRGVVSITSSIPSAPGPVVTSSVSLVSELGNTTSAGMKTMTGAVTTSVARNGTLTTSSSVVVTGTQAPTQVPFTGAGKKLRVGGGDELFVSFIVCFFLGSLF